MNDPPQNADDVRKIVNDNGIEFLFAQFVDMHGKPSAKLVPAHHLDDLLTEGAGFAGFAAGDIGQGPDDPDMIAMPDPRTLTILPWRPTVARFACDVTVEGEEWPYCPRTILRRALARAAELGYELKIGRRARVLPAAPGRRRLAGARRPARHARPALLRHARADAQPRLRLRGVRAVTGLGWDNYANDHEDANGQFEQNFAYRRRADHLRPGDLLPLHGRVPGPAAWADRHVHAQAVRPPHRQRLPLPRQPVEGRRERVRARPGRGPARARPLRAGLQLHRRPEGQRQGLHRGHRADRELLQAAGRRARRPAAPRGLRPTSATATTTARRCCASRRRADRGPHGRRLVQPLPGGDGDARRRPGRDRARARPRRAQRGQPLHDERRRARARPGSSCCRPTCSTPRASWPRNAALRAGLGTTRDGDYIDYFIECKRREVQAAHEQITDWELERYLQLF